MTSRHGCASSLAFPEDGRKFVSVGLKTVESLHVSCLTWAGASPESFGVEEDDERR